MVFKQGSQQSASVATTRTFNYLVRLTCRLYFLRFKSVHTCQKPKAVSQLRPAVQGMMGLAKLAGQSHLKRTLLYALQMDWQECNHKHSNMLIVYFGGARQQKQVVPRSVYT